MGYCKDMWMNKQECVIDDLASGEIDREEAITQLVRLGFDRQEAADMTGEAVS
jgi:hypothetical protein